MTQVTHITLNASADGQRLDRWLKKTYPYMGFGPLQKTIRTGQLRVNGKRAKADTILHEGDELRLPPQLNPANREKQETRISDKDAAWLKSLIIFEDDNILALNKPHGVAVQGGSKTTRHIDGLLPSLTDKRGNTPKLAHRIDKDTSGLLVLSKNNEYARILANAFKQKQVNKAYLAVCTPTPKHEAGTIKAKLGKAAHHGDKETMVVDEENGKTAITHYQTLDYAGRSAALVAFSPVTGRTHQIRVHAQIMGSPILGDPKYQIEQVPNHDMPLPSLEVCAHKGLHLHAYAMHLDIPGYRKGLTLKAPLSNEMRSSMKTLGFTEHNIAPETLFTNLSF